MNSLDTSLHKRAGAIRAAIRLAAIREANKHIPDPPWKASRQFKRAEKRAAAKASLSRRKRIAAQTSTKGGSATLTRNEGEVG